ncbi:MAG TPA: discoidin domain-containing protein [Candidatus Avipropionibacterium avicola]|uniref:Discoidin domain-containing protein n=1 Tax=Candidatus Avipropionibacterium avicola TaxID=2840701 RepID=A0A9D1H026_9ACTN|nr:discoidin domain-containing protein [Candidatus Avipropionibacterium avicola]
MMRTLRRLTTVLVLAGALLLGPTMSTQAAPTSDVVVTTDVDAVAVTPVPCGNGSFLVRLTNEGSKAVFADALVEAAEGLELSADIVSTYLPPGYTFVEQVKITPPEEPGDYPVAISVGESRTEVMVTVDDSTIGDNLARLGVPAGSTSYNGRPPCGAIDGNTDSDQWSFGVGWSDNTNNVFPDWWTVEWDEPVTVSRVVLTTVDSEALPAATQGMRDWDIQVRDGDDWRTVASVRDNVEGSVTSEFDPVTTSAMRVLCIGANGHYSRILEFEAYA